MGEAVRMSIVWIGLALLFNVYILIAHGSGKAMEYFTGYIVEKSLSVDNLFVFLTIFSYFKVPKQYQQKVLFWGIAIAMILRGVFIFAGIGLIEKFNWLIYVFGAFLVYTGIKMYYSRGSDENPANSVFVKFLTEHMPFTHEFNGPHFMVVINGEKKLTRLFLVFIVLNFVDVMFAFDSIPAVFAITLDPYIVYTSNIFAILGLRALYFVLAGAIDSFYYINHALTLILCFVGFKMLFSAYVHISSGISLIVIAVILTAAIIASVIRNKKNKA
jgi:tellurite resistance protein TerC